VQNLVGTLVTTLVVFYRRLGMLNAPWGHTVKTLRHLQNRKYNDIATRPDDNRATATGTCTKIWWSSAVRFSSYESGQTVIISDMS